MAIKSIGIDIREATEKGAGKGRYALELTRALIAAAPDLHFCLYTKKPNPLFPSGERIHQVVICGRGPLWHLNLRRHIRHEPVDLFIAPTSYIYPAIAPRHQKTAVVIHDLIAFLHSKNHPWFPTMVERLTLPRALKKAGLLLCVSEHTQKDLEHLFPEAKSKATLILPPAVSEEIHHVDTQKMDLPTEFLLGVGTLLPRKNFSLLIEAFKRIHTRHPDLQLCIAGGKAAHTGALYEPLSPELHKKIHFLGYVSTAELCELYSRARMLVFPSTYEGFGIPPLEAMACGCPVIVSNASSLPEVVEDAALKVGPHHPQELAEAIELMLQPKAAKLYREKGLQRVKAFSWKSSAEKLLRHLFN